MRFKAIIFDLDGTAIPNAQHALPSRRLVEVIKRAQSSYKISAATGRPISNAKPILDALNLVDPCVISAGTEIINPRNDEIFWEYDIEAGDVQKVLEICKPYPYELSIGNEGVGNGSKAADLVISAPVNVMYLMQCSPQDTIAVMGSLDKIQNITASEVPSWTGDNIDIHITHRDATKEHAITKLLDILGVSKEETIGVGDGNNDVHLFKAVGYKVAMGNATELLKSQADFVCDSVANDGLAKLIEGMLN